jgi:antitoxin ParD1/3/4
VEGFATHFCNKRDCIPVVKIATVILKASYKGFLMSTVEKISVALPAEMVAILRAAVDSGEYSSASEVIREALRGWKLKRKVEALELDELRRLVKEGIESGPSIDAELVFSRLRAKYAAMLSQEKEA